jgi:catechol 2,3-dioxygenase-like lactoylglutathione lyase family enzyme
MKVDINGMAHVVLTVSDFPRARAFYASLLPAFGMKPVFDGPKFTYFVGASPNTVHFEILIAAVKSIRTVGSGVRGRSG